jgi:hypothetical protein
MSADASRTAARRFLEEVVNRQDEGAVDELLADDVVFHEPPSRGGTRYGREGVKGTWGRWPPRSRTSR